ncbi:MAG: DUF308 domain-containing protein [Nitrospira sp. LK70]|nr:DUF308 domain-containing protein [Nitrospira sp. LK70]
MLPPAILHEDELERLPLRWWAINLRRLLGILLGTIAFFMPVVALLALVYLFGVYVVFDGVLNLLPQFSHWNCEPIRRKPRHGEETECGDPALSITHRHDRSTTGPSRRPILGEEGRWGLVDSEGRV